jgi:hypothetical protein
MNRSICTVLLLLSWFLAFNQELLSFPANHPGAGIFSDRFSSPAIMLLQPAALGRINNVGLHIAATRPYGIPGLSSAAAQFTFPLQSFGGAGLHIGSSGNDYFRRLSLSLAAGKQLSRNISLGVLFGAMPVSVAGNNHTRWTAGFSFILGNKTGKVGVHYLSEFLHNFPSDERLHWLRLGFGRDWSEFLYTDFEVTIGGNRKVNTVTNFRYAGISGLVSAVGFTTNPGGYCIELGWTKGKYSIVTLTRWAPSIGWSPGIGLLYAK